jgi:hypothetical protein
MRWCEIEPPIDLHLFVWIYQELAERLDKSGGKLSEALLRFVSCLKERPDVFRELQNPLLLSYSARLFERHSLTASYDTDLFEKCLTLLVDEWDERKNISRFYDSWTRPHNLFRSLSSLCYHTLIAQMSEFTSQKVESWVSKYPGDAPTEKILGVLSELTGIIQPSHDGKWRFAHTTFQEYLAARYVVESSKDATQLLAKWLNEPRVSNVLKFACAVTNDASNLLRFALTADWPGQAEKMAALADIIAQQLTAEPELIKRSCETLGNWFDSLFANWEVTTMDNDEQIPIPKWRLTARKTKKSDALDPNTRKSLLRSLHAVHRARSSPAKPHLFERLSASPNGVVKAMGASLEVEGYLQAKLLPHHENDVLVAEVVVG